MTPRTVLSGGAIVDGSGHEPTLADLVIDEGVVCEILPAGTTYGGGWQVVDCSGLLVAPGFMDIHCHSDLSLFAYPGNESRITQGITTEIVGNCGMTPAPSFGDNDGLASVIGTIDVVPELEWTWNDFQGWLSALETVPKATNVAAHIGHGSARFAVAGPQAHPLVERELSALDGQLRAALEAGAVGVSLGLMYAPGEGADLTELVRVGNTVAEYDGVVSVHMRDYSGFELMSSVGEVVNVANRSGARTQISHLRQLGEGSFTEVLDVIDGARSSIDIAADAYPYIAGHTNLVQLFPGEIRGKGLRTITEFCRSNRSEAAAALAGSGHTAEGITIMKAPRVPELIGKRATGLCDDPWLGLVDLLIANEGLVDIAVVGSKWSDVDLGYQRPWVSVASDGTALSGRHEASMPHPRSWGAFPAAYRRMRDMGLTIGESIRRLTDGPAARVGLTARLLRGARADVVIFDEETFDSAATYRSPSCPASGMRHVYVGGQAVLHDGIITGARPGRLIRGGQSA